MNEQKIIKIPKVDKIKIKNFGIIKKANIDFSPKVNLIVGPNRSGKTTVLKYLIEKNTTEKKSIEEKILQEINNELNGCILIDDSLNLLEKEKLIKTIDELEKSNKQIVATLSPQNIEIIMEKTNANIIETKNFEIEN